MCCRVSTRVVQTCAVTYHRPSTTHPSPRPTLEERGGRVLVGADQGHSYQGQPVISHSLEPIRVFLARVLQLRAPSIDGALSCAHCVAALLPKYCKKSAHPERGDGQETLPRRAQRSVARAVTRLRRMWSAVDAANRHLSKPWQLDLPRLDLANEVRNFDLCLRNDRCRPELGHFFRCACISPLRGPI